MQIGKIFVFPTLVRFVSLVCISHALDTLKPGDILRTNQTLVSYGGVFELGFFPFGDVTKQYLGIWFKNDRYKKAVWLANQDYPLLGNSGYMYIRNDGNLMISDIRGLPVPVNTERLATNGNTSARLHDSGNLILCQEKVMVWQSFDYPIDTFLPGMRLGIFNIDNVDHSRQLFLVSWLSPLDPSRGQFYLGMNPSNRTQIKVWRTTDGKVQDIGFWNGNRFVFFFQTRSKNYNFRLEYNKKEIYLTFTNNERNVTSWFELGSNGDINELTMIGEEISAVKHSLCHDALVVNSSSKCLLMPSFCTNGYKFSEIKGSISNSIIVSWPARLGLSECEIVCKRNCTCYAYASNLNGGTTLCELYYRDKTHLLMIERGNHTIYVRSDAPTRRDSGHRSKWRTVLAIVMVSLISLILITLMILFLCCLKRRKIIRIGIDTSQTQSGDRSQTGVRRPVWILPILFDSKGKNKINVTNRNDLELCNGDRDQLHMLSFFSIETATNNFSFANKLGEGGFGSVYKGKLLGQEIAVKRLSKYSGQGFEEFKNEVRLISELQHRNLVKLLGCCIQQEELLLVYEYMENKSLDSFIFDSTKRKLLDWKQRKYIIEGIAQGLLYLHKYSRLRVIHRDMKTSNILLDSEMNPKISDFGMARICHGNENEAVTRRIVGTYGYMSPEYAVHGHFSTKSDVFSYGVILLEIVSGRKNSTTFEYSDRSLNLLGYAWKLWIDNRGKELVDSTLVNSCSMREVQLCIQVGLLCVQENPEDRPTMSDVLSMFENERTILPAPTQPALSTYLGVGDTDSPRMLPKLTQIHVTISAVVAR